MVKYAHLPERTVLLVKGNNLNELLAKFKLVRDLYLFLVLRQKSDRLKIPDKNLLNRTKKLDSLKLLPMKNIYIFVASNGGLAQLARAFDWQYGS